MKVLFTKHAENKFLVLRLHGVNISKVKVISTISTPALVDHASRYPLVVAQGPLDKYRVLRVIYKRRGDNFVVVTFYPGKKSQYEKGKN